jgi:hypothetical protein
LQKLDSTRLRDIFIGNRLKSFYSYFELKINKRAVTPNVQETNINLWGNDIRDEDNENENKKDDNNNNKEKKNKKKQLAIPKN